MSRCLGGGGHGKEEKRWSPSLYTHDVTCKLGRWNSGCNDIYKNDQQNFIQFFHNFCFLPLCVKYINTRYISIQNIGRSIPLKTTNWIGVNSLITVYVFTT